MKLPPDIADASPEVQKHYRSMVRKGTAPLLAEMLALRAAPRCLTDAVAGEGFHTLGQQFEGGAAGKQALQHLVRCAKRHGYTPSASDHYDPFLARFTGDPEAFYKAEGMRGHIKKVCEKRGWSNDSVVKVKGREPESDPHEVRTPSKRTIRERQRRLRAGLLKQGAIR